MREKKGDQHSSSPANFAFLRGKFSWQGKQNECPFIFLATKEELCEWAVTQCTMGRHLYALVMKGKKKEFKDPDEPDDKATEIKTKKYFRDLDEVRKNKEKYEAGTAAFLMFSLKLCHPALRRRLQTMTKPKCLEDTYCI